MGSEIRSFLTRNAVIARVNSQVFKPIPTLPSRVGMPSTAGIPEETIELNHYGYIDPYLVHALKLRPQNAIVLDRRWIYVHGVGKTGLKLPYDIEHGLESDDVITVHLWNGLFLCQPGPVHTNPDLQAVTRTTQLHSTPVT